MNSVDFNNLRMVLNLKMNHLGLVLKNAKDASDHLTDIYRYDSTPAAMGCLARDNNQKAINELTELHKTIMKWIDDWEAAENKLKEVKK